MATKDRKYRLKFLFQEFDLTKGEFSIGRSPSCSLTLEDPLVSRRHACITVTDEGVTLDDLGSRNGTLVNGEPIFDHHPLTHYDKIRIGTHELIFIEEKKYPPIKLKPTEKLIFCPSCNTPFSRSSDRCPNCGALLIPDKICMQCRTPAERNALFCSKCGAMLDRDEMTVPVELGGGSAGWTAKLIDEVIEKAVSAGRYEQAARLLDGKIAEFEKETEKQEIDIGTLAVISRFNLIIAKGLRNRERIEWVIDYWDRSTIPMPESLLKHLSDIASGWPELGECLESYLATLESWENISESSFTVSEKLREIIAKTRE